jgi:hypothetical protein
MNATCLVAATCRDVAPFLPANLRTLEAMGGCFRACDYVFVENDSRDATLELLRAFAPRSGRVEVLALGALSKTMKRRTERLAHCRNLVLDRLDHDYLV